MIKDYKTAYAWQTTQKCGVSYTCATSRVIANCLSTQRTRQYNPGPRSRAKWGPGMEFIIYAAVQR